MFETTSQEIDTNIKYKDDWRDNIVKKVVDNFTTWDRDRQKQITWIDEIQDLLDMVDVLSKDEDGKIIMKDVTVRRIYRTIVARLYNSTFKTPTQMFSVNVQGESNEENKHFNYIQKQAILNVIKMAKTKKECLEGIRNLIKMGEIILFVNWKQDFNVVRRKEGLNFDLFGQQVDLRKWVIKKELKYDGVEVTNINPKDFVWDIKRNNFNSALKIKRGWKTLSEITSNDGYKKYLSDDAIETLTNKVERKENSSTVHDDDKHLNTSLAYDGNMIEVLECYGDINVEINNKVEFFPNMKIVVIGREFIGCFEYNPGIINPFIKFSIEDDPEIGRGIPLLSGLVPISIAIKDVLNKYHTALGLSINKHFFAPMGTLAGNGKDGKTIKLDELGITEYNDTLGDMSKLVPLDMSSGLQYAIQGMEYYKQQQQDETQTYNQSSGDSEQQAKTLGQAKLLQQNQNIIEACDNDLFCDNVILGLVEIIAEFMANFKDSEEQITYKDGQGKEYQGTIDDTIRQGSYIYTVEDSAASMDKKMNISEYIDVLLTKIAPYMGATGQGVLSATEILTELGSAYEQEDPTRIILQPQQPTMGDIDGQQAGMPIDVSAMPTEGMAIPPAEIS